MDSGRYTGSATGRRSSRKGFGTGRPPQHKREDDNGARCPAIRSRLAVHSHRRYHSRAMCGRFAVTADLKAECRQPRYKTARMAGENVSVATFNVQLPTLNFQGETKTAGGGRPTP